MARSMNNPVRRRAADWAKVVRAWKRSGETAAAFAESRGMSPRTLTWWKWKLASGDSSTSPPRKRRGRRSKGERRPSPSIPRLVAVEVQPDRDAGVAWELQNARGDALRVMSGIAPGDLARVLAVLFTGEDSP